MINKYKHKISQINIKDYKPLIFFTIFQLRNILYIIQVLNCCLAKNIVLYGDVEHHDV